MLRILTRLWSEDSSTPVSTETESQGNKKFPNKDHQKRKRPEQIKYKKGGRETVLKNLTRLWSGSSSTLTGNKRNKTNPPQTIKLDSTNEAAPEAVGGEVYTGGEGAGKEELEALTVFSQKIQTREKRKTERERREQSTRTSQRKERRRESKSTRRGVERGAGNPGTSLARKTRSQRERGERIG